MRELAGAIVGALLVGLCFAGPALAQQYPPSSPTVGVSDSTLAPGAPVTVTGQNWKPGSTVDLTFHSQVFQLGTATVRSDGTFSKTVTIPSSATPGRHFIQASGLNSNGDPRVVRTAVTIVGAGAGTAGTGANIGAGVTLLAVLLLFGVLALAVGRRKLRA